MGSHIYNQDQPEALHVRIADRVIVLVCILAIAAVAFGILS